MRRVIGMKVLSHEGFVTVRKQIGAVLDSRTIIAVSNYPNDPPILTPAHFLVGGPMSAAPQAESEEANANINTHYKLLKKLHDELLRMWKRDGVTNSEKMVFKRSRFSNW